MALGGSERSNWKTIRAKCTEDLGDPVQLPEKCVFGGDKGTSSWTSEGSVKVYEKENKVVKIYLGYFGTPSVNLKR